MTVGSQVKQCLSSLKSIEATLNSLAIKTENEEARLAFHETCLKTRKVIGQIETRVGEIEFQEPQYKGF
ncbi:hypothetical protein BKP37_17300 [Anaerobacillus alkalilacustris]|uniref:DUF1657 domain-containing protein n=1 Tax=Anaerobacillus alkalilacustris TaxID=393763 RepID=A0A1S2LGT2_9BACI|nr:DUF1657 domain-containing protein [Anaerobacillus alkalilacustris]OIJ10695.1 hypothetical protein BKP37_17300 [Anaerobacillus alkalilacustris]